jgi:F0F1-type ATP synthase membrane subunit b/b'
MEPNMFLRLILFVLLVGLLYNPSLEASSTNQQDTIKVITEQLKTVDNPKEKAKLYCYRARN